MFCGDTARAGWFVLISCRCRMRGWHLGWWTGPGASVDRWLDGSYRSPDPQAPYHLGVGGPRGGRDEGVAGPLPQARRVRGGPRGRARTRSLPLLTHVGSALSAIEKRGGGYGHQGEVAVSGKIYQGHPEAVPRKQPGHPAGGSRPRGSPRMEKWASRIDFVLSRGRAASPAWATSGASPTSATKRWR